jgi:hypothetical protein
MVASKRTLARLKKQYDQIYESLSSVELQRGMRGLDELELNELFEPEADLWLGFYTQEGIELALERYGIFDDIRGRGFKKLRVELQMDDPDEHMLRIYSELPQCDEPLLELVVSRGLMRFEPTLGEELCCKHATVLTVHWLLMQNPTSAFRADKPPLPGQCYPGLGVGAQVLEILANACRRLKLSGLVTVPAHFHNAAMYGLTFQYANPECEGAFRALESNLLDQLDGSLPKASWAVRWNMVIDRLLDHAEPFEWFHEAMVWPLDEPLKSCLQSERYRQKVDAARDSHHFEVFERALQRNLHTRGLDPWDRARVDAWIAERDRTV